MEPTSVQPVGTDPVSQVPPEPMVMPPADPVPYLPEAQPAAPLQQPVAAQQPPQQPYWQSQAPAPVNSPGLIVLQWLTYAFWGWTILAMSVLTISVLANFIAKAETGSFTPYGIAAVLVLLPISIACDVFYSRKEPAKKNWRGVNCYGYTRCYLCPVWYWRSYSHRIFYGEHVDQQW